MDLITQGYGSSSSDSEDTAAQKPAKIAKTSSLQVNGAPDVSLEDPNFARHMYTNPTDTTLAVNIFMIPCSSRSKDPLIHLRE
ncbi:unnamed protein product [Mortierella alpina]